MKALLTTLATLSLLSLPSALPAEEMEADENPIATISHDPGFLSIFHHWGFIGDSLSSGELESRSTDGKERRGWHDMYEDSWGQRICAATGTEGENYSQGGETTFGWIEHFWNNPKNGNNNIDAKAHPKQAYIIALGENDENIKFPIGDTEKDINLEDYNKNDSTFTGCYAGIIQRVKSIQPDAKFFVVTMPKGNDPYNKVIRQMPELFRNVYLIDLEKHGGNYWAKDFRERYFLGGHMNVAGYQWAAYMFMTYINWIIEHNWQDFVQAGFIGTPHKY